MIAIIALALSGSVMAWETFRMIQWLLEERNQGKHKSTDSDNN